MPAARCDLPPGAHSRRDIQARASGALVLSSDPFHDRQRAQLPAGDETIPNAPFQRSPDELYRCERLLKIGA
jgi:hypothetical protein